MFCQLFCKKKGNGSVHANPKITAAHLPQFGTCKRKTVLKIQNHRKKKKVKPRRTQRTLATQYEKKYVAKSHWKGKANIDKYLETTYYRSLLHFSPNNSMLMQKKKRL